MQHPGPKWTRRLDLWPNADFSVTSHLSPLPNVKPSRLSDVKKKLTEKYTKVISHSEMNREKAFLGKTGADNHLTPLFKISK